MDIKKKQKLWENNGNKNLKIIHNINGDERLKMMDYYYKGYDITNKNRLERVTMEYANPYGYNFESNEKRYVNLEYNASHTNQNNVKNR